MGIVFSVNIFYFTNIELSLTRILLYIGRTKILQLNIFIFDFLILFFL